MNTRPQKAYILRHESEISHKYAKITAESCDKVDMPWQYWDGFCNMSKHEIWTKLGLFDPLNGTDFPAHSKQAKAAACTASHHAIWNDIVKNKIASAVILEHDAVMLHKPDIDIPDMMLVGLGYRVLDPVRYNHTKAGAPQKVVPVHRISGTHAYAINNVSANYLISQIKEKNAPCGCIDAHLFDANIKNRVFNVNLGMCDPISSVAWIRESTIQSRPMQQNINPISSFQNNLL